MSFHLYTINEIYSNADGTIQFIELINGPFSGQNLWRGHAISVNQGGVTHSFAFPSDLPSSNTANTTVLIATQGFADLGIVTPDFIVPANFLFTAGSATVDFGGVNAVTYASLPTDGTQSLNRNLVAGTNSPTNFAHLTGTVPPPTFNLITGTAGPDTLVGTAGRDKIDALDGNDVVDGAGGDDQLIGGNGIDTAVFHGPRAAFVVGPAGATISGPDGNDVLTGIERARFADVTTEFLANGAAGQSVKLLSAVFGSAFVHDPVYIGIGVSFFDAGRTYQAVADLALHAKLGPTPTDAQVVQLLYTNVVGTAPDAQTTSAFVALITSAQFTQVSLTAFAADHDLNLARVDLIGLAQHGIDYIPFTG